MSREPPRMLFGRLRLTAYGLLLIAAPLAVSATVEDARYRAFIAELRCLVCQNQSIAESNAPLAADLREQVRAQIEAGRSDAEIVEFVTARYGDFVLYRPPFKASTWLLWLGPFAVLGLAGGIAVIFVRRSDRKHASEEFSEPVIRGDDEKRGSRPQPLTLVCAGLGVLAFAAVWYVLAGSWRTQALLSLAKTKPAAAERAAFAETLDRLRRALAQNPNDPQALWLLGLAALREGNEPAALGYWERLARQQLPDEVRASLEHGLAQLRERTGAKPVLSPVEGAAAAEPPLRLTLAVSVAPELRAEARPDDVLFVYAQAVGEGNMPLAVRRLEAVQFPLQVSLDDSHSMVPARRLSSVERWRLVARLSRSGNALPHPGDLEGELLLSRDQAQASHNLVIGRRRQ